MKTIGPITALRLFIFLIMAAVINVSCNKDGTITKPQDKSPVIKLDNSTRVYKARVNEIFYVTPTIANSEGAVFSWKLGSQIISTDTRLEYSFAQNGKYYITLRVDNNYGYDQVELRVDVSDLAPPVISLAVPPQGIKLKVGSSYIFSPDVKNAEGAAYKWEVQGEQKGTQKDYVFQKNEPGIYNVTLTVRNGDGFDTKKVQVEVLESLPLEIIAANPSINFGDPLLKSVFEDGKIYLRPIIINAVDPSYSWSVNGAVQHGETGPVFAFTPGVNGRYEVTLTVTDSEAGASSITYTVTCEGTEDEGIRSPTGNREFDKIWEYVPAPGQFINDRQAGFTDDITTMEAACSYAERRLKAGAYVTLGAWGGYLVAGFDHSIQNKGGAGDFSIGGNSFPGASEPGVVWVMQDVNGNGEPDDEWYELKGSEYGKPETIHDYSVTYYKPGGAGMAVQWTDNRNNSGRVDYLRGHHDQDHYYPGWIGQDSYTLSGTRLKDNVSIVGDKWVLGSFGWGYADNEGSDTNPSSEEGEVAKTYFKISNAIYPDGTPANLKYIDFVKVQSGVNSKAGILGEVSTEIMSIEDLNI